MGRPTRTDSPGSIYHIVNRGVAHRPMFESDRDVRRFEQRLERLVDRGSAAVEAHAILQTHYHLLLVSLDGQVSRSLHFLQAPYSNWYNWSRERDGPLVRGRFFSKRVDSEIYRRCLVRYIDANPVLAGLATSPADYPHCSAHHYRRRHGPAWLSRGWVEGQVVSRLRIAEYDPGRYFEVFPTGLEPARLRMIESDLASRAEQDQPLDLLLRISTTEMTAWLLDRIAMADGVRRLRPIVAPEIVDAVVRAAHPGAVAPRGVHRGRRSPAGPTLALLLRTFAGLQMGELAAVLGCSQPTACRLWREGSKRAAEDPDFAASVAALAQRIVHAFWDDL